MAPAEALALAKSASPKPATGIDPHDAIGIMAGTQVSVSPVDYAEVNVVGKLVGTTVGTVSVWREDPRVGEVVVHFPKIGYRIDPV